MVELKDCVCLRPDRRDIPGGILCFSCGHTDFSAGSESSDVVDAARASFNSTTRKSHFKYKPLGPPLAIRLVRLYAGGQEEELQGEIFTSSLADHPDYEGLSYVWGNGILSHTIHTAQGPLNITSNCAAALKQLRNPRWDRVLWIDAICINQASAEEKNRQVPLMSKIYAEASQVIIFLGYDPRPNINLFFDYFRREEPSSKNRVLQPALSAFLSKPWFSRVWVLQEVAVAKKAIMLWGSETLDWKYLSAAHVDALGLHLVDKDGKAPPVLRLAENDKKPLKDLASLINTARSCQSTDPRDKVYALLGLLSDHVVHTLVPDYAISVETLHIEVAMLVINSSNNLDVLSDVGNETKEEMEAADALRAKVDSLELVARLKASRIPTLLRELAEKEKRAERPRAVAMRAEFNERMAWCEFEDICTRKGISTALVTKYFDESSWQSPTNAEEVRQPETETTKVDPDAWWSVVAKGKAWLEARKAFATTAKDPLIEDAETAARAYQSHLPSPSQAFYIISRNLHSPGRFNGGHRYSGLHLPSWVPDLGRQPPLTSLSHFRTKQTSSQSPENLARLCKKQELPVLEIRILEVDTLATGSPDHPAGPTTLFSREDLELEYDLDERFLHEFVTDPHLIRHGSSIASFQSFCQGRRWMQTVRSWAICSGRAESRDIICAIYGASVPFVLRPVPGTKSHYKLIGECYLHGLRGPKFVDDYLTLLGEFRKDFQATTSQALPWQKAYLE